MALLIGACGSTDKSVQHDVRLRELLPGAVGRIQAVLFLKESGCMTCNRAFAQLLQQHVNDQRVLLVIMGGGAQVDLSPFLGPVTNVRFDHDGRLATILGCTASCAMIIKEGEIDTTLVLNARNLYEQLTWIEQRLSER